LGERNIGDQRSAAPFVLSFANPPVNSSHFSAGDGSQPMFGYDV